MRRKRTYLVMWMVMFLLSHQFFVAADNNNGPKVSRPGRYEGYSSSVYREWVRTSEYVSMCDGTKLAVDIFRPAVNGEPVREPLPVIWTLQRYGRRLGFWLWKYDIMKQLPWLQTVLQHGYVVAAADARGAGASFGVRRSELPLEEEQDAYDLTEWFAGQPWCNGNVGMFGRSYLGMAQYLAAGAAPPHLKAIFPEMAPIDLYTNFYPGGVLLYSYLDTLGKTVNYLDSRALTAPVDVDPKGILLKEARGEHQANQDFPAEIRRMPFRDSVYEGSLQPYLDLSPYRYFEAMAKSGVAVYILAGWYDGYTRDALICFNNLGLNRKMVICPWNHMQTTGFDLAAEHLRWFDYWLKGIDNGIMTEPPITYGTMGAARGKEWRTAWRWPLPEQNTVSYYFHAGPSRSVTSANDGLLGTDAPVRDTGEDVYGADYSTTSGRATRWTNMTTGPFGYPDMTANDRKGLTYTTPPLAADTEITGSPVMHLWLTSTARDGDFFAYLEDMDARGYSHYVTEGMLRASHRALSEPPYNMMGLPYHRSFAADIRELPAGEPVELVFDLLPTSYVFAAGHRIRVTVTCADRDNALTPFLSPRPRASIYRNSEFPSRVDLPVVFYPGND